MWRYLLKNGVNSINKETISLNKNTYHVLTSVEDLSPIILSLIRSVFRTHVEILLDAIASQYRINKATLPPSVKSHNLICLGQTKQLLLQHLICIL